MTFRLKVDIIIDGLDIKKYLKEVKIIMEEETKEATKNG